MKRKRIDILFCLAKMPLLFLYVSFFTVQLFFNFDIANNPDNTTILFSYKNADAAHQSPGIRKANKATNKKQTIRLNKRFEPKVIPAYNAVIMQSPFSYSEKKAFVSTSDVFIPAPFFLSQSFRGPPVVA